MINFAVLNNPSLRAWPAIPLKDDTVKWEIAGQARNDGGLNH